MNFQHIIFQLTSFSVSINFIRVQVSYLFTFLLLDYLSRIFLHDLFLQLHLVGRYLELLSCLFQIEIFYSKLANLEHLLFRHGFGLLTLPSSLHAPWDWNSLTGWRQAFDRLRDCNGLDTLTPNFSFLHCMSSLHCQMTTAWSFSRETKGILLSFRAFLIISQFSQLGQDAALHWIQFLLHSWAAMSVLDRHFPFEWCQELVDCNRIPVKKLAHIYGREDVPFFTELDLTSLSLYLDHLGSADCHCYSSQGEYCILNFSIGLFPVQERWRLAQSRYTRFSLSISFPSFLNCSMLVKRVFDWGFLGLMSS